MEHILFIIKIWATVQFIIIILIILLFYVARYSVYRSLKNHNLKIKKINKLLNEINDNPNILTPRIIRFFNRSILEFPLCVAEADKKNFDNPNWNRTKKLLCRYVLKKQAKKLSASKNWLKRYLSILCYELAENVEDEKTLLSFIKDDNLIVSINAAMLIFKTPNAVSVNKVITTLSKERRILQNTFASMLAKVPYEKIDLIRSIFLTRLNEEKIIYVRMFCYRVLNELEPTDKLDSFVDEDLLSKEVNLEILALKYVAHVAGNRSIPILLLHLNDASNEVRSIIVKLFGEIGDKSAIPYLREKLNDKAWWVRINSANSLLNLGAEGIAVLNEQSPHDRFAYEAAQACLKIYQYSKQEHLPA